MFEVCALTYKPSLLGRGTRRPLDSQVGRFHLFGTEFKFVLASPLISFIKLDPEINSG